MSKKIEIKPAMFAAADGTIYIDRAVDEFSDATTPAPYYSKATIDALMERIAELEDDVKFAQDRAKAAEDRWSKMQ